MAKLEAVLEQRGVASPREVSEAAALSLLHGGDVTTSLLQFANVDEAALSAALSTCHDLPAAKVGPLPAPAADTPSLPREVAERYCCFPLQASGDELLLAVARPLTARVKEELGFALGMRLTEQVALEVRVRQAIALHYAVPLSERDRLAIARLEGALETKPEEQSLGSWDDAELSALPRPPSEPPPPPLPPVAERPEWAQERAHAPRPAAQARWGRRRGPFTLSLAREELARASSRDQVLEAFFSFACQFFEYTALFAVHSSLAEGLSAWGPGADHAAIQAVGVPLDLPSSLSEAAESCKLRITRLGRDGIDRTLAVDLRRQLASRVLILPVSLRGRCAVLLYGDNGTSDVIESEVSDVAALAPDVAAALGRIILQRKRDAAARQSIDPTELSESLAPPRKAPVPAFAHPAPSVDLSEGTESEGQDFALPELPSKTRDRSRSNGRKGSVPPPAVEAARELAQSEAALTDRSELAGVPAAVLDSPTEPAPRKPSTPPEEPVFLLGKGGAAAEPPKPEPARPLEPPRPPLQRGITHPRPVLQQRRLPSVIVDETTTEQSAWTRAGAVTQPPLSAREAALVRSAALAGELDESPTVRPSGKRPAPEPRLDILPATATRGAEALPARVVAKQGAEPKPAAPPIRAPFPVAMTPATPPVAPVATIPVTARKKPAPERVALIAAASFPLEVKPAPTVVLEPAATPEGSAAREAATLEASTTPEASAEALPAAELPAAPAALAPAPDAPPIKPFGQRAITGPPRRGAMPAPPFHRDRPSAPPAASVDARPGSPSSIPPATRGGGIAIARPDSPSVKPVPRTPTARPPGPSGAAPAAHVNRGTPSRSAPRSSESGSRAAVPAPTLATADVFSPPAAPEPPLAAGPDAAPPEAASNAASPVLPGAVAASGPAASASAASSVFGSTANIAALIADTLETHEREPTTRMPEVEARALAAASAERAGSATQGDSAAQSNAAQGDSAAQSNAAQGDSKARPSGEPLPLSERSAAHAATASAVVSSDAVTSAPPDVRRSAAPSVPPASQQAPGSSPRRTLMMPSAPLGQPELETLIDQLCQGNPRAAQDVTRLGATTVPQLMARFPGPVVSERAGPSSRASECGPLLQALANIGSPAVPDILRSTEDQDARVRRWATLLLGEIPGPEACRAVIQRLADDVPRVHQAALDAARLLLSSSAANLFRKTLFEVAEAEDAPLALRLRTLEHVARLRDSASVPRLISFLSLDTEPVVHKALWVLTVITRQDLGRDVSAWNDWWQNHQFKHRFQWLIEALDHPDVRQRKAAADELQVEAKESFGYSEQLPQPERQAAQRRYEEWWETTGARRFGRLQ